MGKVDKKNNSAQKRTHNVYIYFRRPSVTATHYACRSHSSELSESSEDDCFALSSSMPSGALLMEHFLNARVTMSSGSDCPEKDTQLDTVATGPYRSFCCRRLSTHCTVRGAGPRMASGAIVSEVPGRSPPLCSPTRGAPLDVHGTIGFGGCTRTA